MTRSEFLRQAANSSTRESRQIVLFMTFFVWVKNLVAVYNFNEANFQQNKLGQNEE